MVYDFTDPFDYEEYMQMVNNFLGPSNEVKEKIICNSHFTLYPVDKKIYKEFEPYLEYEYEKKYCILMNICIDRKIVNNNVYICRIDSFDYLYSKIKDYNEEKHYFEFFTKCEISQYTQEEVNKYNEDYERYNYHGEKRKVGQKYLKKTDVIINLKTGEEVTFIDIPKYNRGYIVYEKYYTTDGYYKIISLETGKVIEYDYGDKIETDNHVIFKAKRNDYNEPIRAIVLNKDTGDISYID